MDDEIQLSKIILPRSLIFYNQGNQTRNRRAWIVGFSKGHIFQKSKSNLVSSKEVLKVIFPSCFGKASLLKNNSRVVSYMKERHVKRNENMPKRLAPFLKILETTLSRNRNINYLALFDYYCPAPHVIGYYLLLKTENAHLEPINYHLEHDQVVGFIMAIFLKCFPLSLWGTRGNQKLVQQCSFGFI
jgi:hypothetical protein